MSHKKITRAKNFDQLKPLENNRAAIVAGWQFSLSTTTAFGGFLDYTQRKSALDLKHDGGETVAEKYRFDKFIDYTQRATAARPNAKEKNATFDVKNDSLSPSGEAKLRRNLQEAQKNGSPLWQGYVSFSTKWLAENQVYDLETGAVRQDILRIAVRRAMSNLRSTENLNHTAFWWGNVQFDANHIHVHIGLAETTSSRPLFNGQRLGKLKADSMTNFKSVVANQIKTLGQSREREEEKMLQKVIGKRKKTVIQQFSLTDTQLHQIEKALPLDQKKWSTRFSYLPQMSDALLLTQDFVQQELHKLPAYREWREAAEQEALKNKNLYGQKSRSTVDNKEAAIIKQLENQVWRDLRSTSDQPPKKLSVAELSASFDQAAREANSREIDALRGRLNDPAEILSEIEMRQLNSDLIVRKMARKLQQIKYQQSQHVALLHRLHESSTNNLSVGDQHFLTQHEAKLAREVAHLQGGHGSSVIFTDVVNVPVNRVTAEMKQTIQQQLKQESKWLEAATDDRLINEVYQISGGKKAAKKFLQNQSQIIEIKAEIKANKLVMNHSKGNRLQALRKENKRLYHQLNGIVAPTGITDKTSKKKLEHFANQNRRFASKQQRHALRRQLVTSAKKSLNLAYANKVAEGRAANAHEELVREIEAEERQHEIHR